MKNLHIDLDREPNLRFRIDSFLVPEAARAEFVATMKRNLAFIEKQPGFRGHVVFEKTSGPGTFDIVTIAMWESAEAIEQAGVRVRAYYQEIGFDMPATLARWQVRAELANFHAPLALQ
ncbi:MAG: antibiotic biosynthesis monooxygenase family protein [Polyangiales bacterium]